MNHATRIWNRPDWRLAVAIFFGAWGLQAFSGSCLAADDANTSLVRVFTKSAKSYVGPIVVETSEEIVILDLVSSERVAVASRDILRVVKPLGLDDAARAAGLAPVVAWRIAQMTGGPKPIGKIAQVTPQVVYITLGQQAGLRVGQRIVAFRNNGEIKNPDTGEVLAIERPRVAELEIVEVNPSYSKARIKGNLEVSLNVGDEIEPAEHGTRVAVCPLLNEDGSLTNLGAGITEDLTTALVQKSVTVVERSVMDMVLGELLIQNTPLFDANSAQKLGNLTGANAVLTGKIVPDRNVGKAYVRLIDVGTGEILFAVSSAVNLSTAKVVQLGAAPRGANSSSESGKPDASQNSTRGARKSSKLGASRALPNFLTTEFRYERNSQLGVRLQGFEKPTIRDVGTIRTKESSYLKGDFTFEVSLTFQPGDRIAYIGLGPGRPDRSYNGLTDSIYLRFHAPDLADGLVDISGFKKGYDTMGKVNHGGTHLVRIIKEGDAVTFYVDPESDGPSDDDLEMTIANIQEFAPYFNSKNVPIFFGGSGFYSEVTLID